MLLRVGLSKKQITPVYTAASHHKTSNMEVSTEPTVPSAKISALKKYWYLAACDICWHFI
jgi:hypothetical protein